MFNRRLVIGALALGAALSLSPLASAMQPVTYSQQAFSAAQAAGKPILPHITAPWCPTCKAQKPILSKLGPCPSSRTWWCSKSISTPASRCCALCTSPSRAR